MDKAVTGTTGFAQATREAIFNIQILTIQEEAISVVDLTAVEEPSEDSEKQGTNP
jgi:hypothetical protein